MKRWLLLLPPALLAGCMPTETVDSTELPTSDIYPEIEVVADSGSSTVTVELHVGDEDSDDYVELQGGDRLEATAGGETKTLSGSGSRYRATFDVDGAGTEFEIAFLRGGDDDDATETSVVLPDPFRVSVDVAEASRSIGVDVPFRWEPVAEDSDLDVYWFIEGDCILDEDGETEDDGEGVIDASQIQTLPADAQASCSVDLAMSRRELGQIDRAFGGGTIRAAQRRHSTFISSP
jgi:hypothetical protein